MNQGSTNFFRFFMRLAMENRLNTMLCNFFNLKVKQSHKTYFSILLHKSQIVAGNPEGYSTLFWLYLKATKASFHLIWVQRNLSGECMWNFFYYQFFRVTHKEVPICDRVNYFPIVGVEVLPAQRHISSLRTNVNY